MTARTLIIGAGPSGLATATALACDDHGDDVEVVDPSGDWLGAWRDRFARLAIAHLRSPAVHHTHPEPFALLAFAQARTPEPDDPQLVRSGGTNLPTTPTFDAFVDHLVAALGSTRQVSATAAVALGIGPRGRPRVLLADGSRREPERVVVATDRRHPRTPRGLNRAVRAGTARTGDSADLADTPRDGHVTVIGGGPSAAHLALTPSNEVHASPWSPGAS